MKRIIFRQITCFTIKVSDSSGNARHPPHKADDSSILQTARIYSNAPRKAPGWRSAVGHTVNLTGVQYVLHTARIYSNAPRKVPGWRSAVGHTVNLTGVQYI